MSAAQKNIECMLLCCVKSNFVEIQGSGSACDLFVGCQGIRLILEFVPRTMDELPSRL